MVTFQNRLSVYVLSASENFEKDLIGIYLSQKEIIRKVDNVYLLKKEYLKSFVFMLESHGLRVILKSKFS